MPDAVSDVTFELVQLHQKAILETLPEKSPLRSEMQTKLAALDLVRRYVAQTPPEKSKTDWIKLLPLFISAVILFLSIIAQLVGVDWKAAL